MLDAFLADIGCKYWAKSVPPEPNSFMADLDTALMQQIFYVPKRKWKPDVQHHCQTNDFRARFEIAKGIAFLHPQKLGDHPVRIKSVSSDNAAG